jgi:hypothetical protein
VLCCLLVKARSFLSRGQRKRKRRKRKMMRPPSNLREMLRVQVPPWT